MSERIDLGDGYTAIIAQDMNAEAPWHYGDCFPPSIIHCSGTANRGNEELGAWHVLSLFPDDEVTPALAERHLDAGDYAEFLEEMSANSEGDPKPSDVRDALCTVIESYRPPARERGYWNLADDYMKLLEGLYKEAGCTVLHKVSTGYCQGDMARVLMVTTPDWRKLTGVSKEHEAEALEGDFNMYNAWAWGDVYGVCHIEDPDSMEIPNSSCWGFYGSDHEKSGLLGHCREVIEYHKEWLDKERAETSDAACRDIETVEQTFDVGLPVSRNYRRGSVLLPDLDGRVIGVVNGGQIKLRYQDGQLTAQPVS